MMHEEPGTPQSPSEAQLHGFEDSQKRDEKERIAAGLPAPVVYEKRVPPPPLPKKTEAEYLTMLFGETVTDADVADLGEWMKKPEQAEISEELAQPVMFHFRAIGDRNKRLFEVWQQFKLSRRPA